MKSNDNFYLHEAFQKLKLVENDFDFTNQDVGVVDELKSFVADDIEAPEEERIIDLDARDANELEDNYIGKVILECDCCHARIYKNQDEVVVDEEAGLANVDEKCPVCNGEFGYKVIGKIEAFDDKKDFEAAADEEEIAIDANSEGEVEADEFDESFKSALTEALEELDEGCDECEKEINRLMHDEGMSREEAEKVAKDLVDVHEEGKEDLEEKKCGGYDCKKDKDIDDAIDKLDDEEAKELDKHSAKAESLDEEDEKFPNPDKHEEVGEHGGIKMYHCKDCGKFAAEIDGKKVKKDSKEELEAAIDAKDESLKDSKMACEDDKKLDEEAELTEANDNLGVKDDINVGDDDKLEQDDAALADAPLNEGVSIDMNNKQVNVDNEDVKVDVNAGVVEVGAEAAGEVAPVADEMIAPLNDEEIAEIEGPAADDLPIDDIGADADLGLEDEAPADDLGADEAGADIEAPAEDEEAEEDEEDFEEFDDEAFADMGESYMKRVYGNVKSFIVEDAKKDGKKLVVEGKVQFESGKEKATSFIFENARITKRNKIVLEGHNEMFSKSNKAFALKGTIVDKKFLGESLIYNYTASQLNEANENETIRVYGRVVKK